MVNQTQMMLEEILEAEKQMVLNARKNYGDYFDNATNFNALLMNFIDSVNPEMYIFTAFLSQIRKHHTLALLSAVRLHHIQAMMDMRQVLEAGVCAAYAIANPDIEDFLVEDGKGRIHLPKKLGAKRYKWIEENYPDGSIAIKKMKDIINNSTAHSNIIYAYKTFSINKQERRFDTPFFDIEDEYLVNTDLFMIGNVAMGLLDLFYGVNRDLKTIKFADDFILRLKELERENDKIKARAMKNPRFKKFKK